MFRIIICSSFLYAGLSTAFADTNTFATCAQLALIARSNYLQNQTFCITAKVVFANRYYLGLQDETGSILALSGTSSVERGDTIRANVWTKHISNISTTLCCWNVEVLSHSDPINPIAAEASDIATGKYDFKLISLKGTVKAAFNDEIDTKFYGASIQSGTHLFYVSTYTPLANIDSLIGTDVTITGICDPRPHPNRKYVGRTIYADPHNGILPHVKTSDPFDAPPISELADISPDAISYCSRHRTSGNVLATWARNRIVVKNADGTITAAKLIHENLPNVGDSIAVSGFPETDLFHINLSQAKWKKYPSRISLKRTSRPFQPTL